MGTMFVWCRWATGVVSANSPNPTLRTTGRPAVSPCRATNTRAAGPDPSSSTSQNPRNSLPASGAAGVGTWATGAGDRLGGTGAAVGTDDVTGAGVGSGQSAVGIWNLAAYSAGWTASSLRS